MDKEKLLTHLKRVKKHKDYQVEFNIKYHSLSDALRREHESQVIGYIIELLTNEQYFESECEYYEHINKVFGEQP